jgi:uncharacterized protein (DUF1810 family)
MKKGPGTVGAAKDVDGHVPRRSKTDPYTLSRFQIAQEKGTAGAPYATAAREMRAGAKASHWIWYCFPQVLTDRGGAKNDAFQIHNIEGEGIEYLKHDVLGKHYIELCNLARGHLEAGVHPDHLMGWRVDSCKLWDSLTTFAIAATVLLATEPEPNPEYQEYFKSIGSTLAALGPSMKLRPNEVSPDEQITAAFGSWDNFAREIVGRRLCLMHRDGQGDSSLPEAKQESTTSTTETAKANGPEETKKEWERVFVDAEAFLKVGSGFVFRQVIHSLVPRK